MFRSLYLSIQLRKNSNFGFTRLILTSSTALLKNRHLAKWKATYGQNKIELVPNKHSTNLFWPNILYASPKTRINYEDIVKIRPTQ